MPELNTSPDQSTETPGAASESAKVTRSAPEGAGEESAVTKTPAKKRAPARKTAKKSATKASDKTAERNPADDDQAAKPKRRPRKSAAATSDPFADGAAPITGPEPAGAPASTGEPARTEDVPRADSVAAQPAVLFQAPDFEAAPLFVPPERSDETSDDKPGSRPGDKSGDKPGDKPGGAGRGNRSQDTRVPETREATGDDDDSAADDDSDESGPRRRRRRGGRGRRRKGDDDATTSESSESDTRTADSTSPSDSSGRGDAASAGNGDDRDDSAGGSGRDVETDSDTDGETSSSRRRRRRRRRSDDADDAGAAGTTKVRDGREVEDEVTSLKGSTRLEAKKQRRREGREAGRRRPPILSEAEFLARRESVDRVMAVRQSGDLTQIAVLEDDVLVEHYVSQAAQQSLIGNVYLGRVQNVLPAMEAAFVDIGRGRNAVIYAGEVDWSERSKNDGPRRIEDVLKSGQSILVQVTKDPIGHKGARLTSQISLPGRYVVYVPGGSMSGISRKLPDTERNRLKNILKKVVPDDAGVIVRTAAEGASEEALTGDVSRLKQQWEAIQAKSGGQGPALLHGEPNLAIKVVRDLFNEDFDKLLVGGDEVWAEIDDYVTHVAPSLADRVQKWTGPGDLFAENRIDEQIAKALDRKVWLPSGGSLVIDRTEAMTVVDVNTGKFTGTGGNLEETVTKNNLEAAEEIVRQLRLRDIGGIIVIDFIDMVLEANRDLVLRRLVECLGRDRTKHQVAEVTSLGLVQMTRKRIGTGLLEAFSEPCPHCKGRGLVMHAHPLESGAKSDDSGGSGSRRSPRGRRRRDEEPAAKIPEPPPGPKLDASALPSHASPADLFAGGTKEDDVDVPSEVATGPDADAPAAAAEATDTAAEEGAVRRVRRRARRAAGEPEAVTGQTATGDTATPAVEPTTVEPPPVERDGSGAASILAEAVPSSPPRRGRRRAQRPAGRPESAPSASHGDSAVPVVPVTSGDGDVSVGGESAASVPHAPVTTVGTAVVETVTRRPRRRVERPAGKPDPHAATDVDSATAADRSDAAGGEQEPV